MLAWVSTLVEMTEVGAGILGGASRAQSLRDDATRRPVMPVTVFWYLAPTRVYAVLGTQKVHALAECWAAITLQHALTLSRILAPSSNTRLRSVGQTN